MYACDQKDNTYLIQAYLEYFYDFYTFRYIIPEEIYAQYQSYDAWKLTQANGKDASGGDIELDFPDNSLIESLSFQNANGVPANIVLDRNGKLGIIIYG